jgi:hypothetical protein
MAYFSWTGLYLMARLVSLRVIIMTSHYSIIFSSRVGFVYSSVSQIVLHGSVGILDHFSGDPS